MAHTIHEAVTTEDEDCLTTKLTAAKTTKSIHQTDFAKSRLLVLLLLIHSTAVMVHCKIVIDEPDEQHATIRSYDARSYGSPLLFIEVLSSSISERGRLMPAI